MTELRKKIEKANELHDLQKAVKDDMKCEIFMKWQEITNEIGSIMEKNHDYSLYELINFK